MELIYWKLCKVRICSLYSKFWSRAKSHSCQRISLSEAPRTMIKRRCPATLTESCLLIIPSDCSSWSIIVAQRSISRLTDQSLLYSKWKQVWAMSTHKRCKRITTIVWGMRHLPCRCRRESCTQTWIRRWLSWNLSKSILRGLKKIQFPKLSNQPKSQNQQSIHTLMQSVLK